MIGNRAIPEKGLSIPLSQTWLEGRTSVAMRPRASKSRRIIVSATGRERGFTESLAKFPEKSRGKRFAVGGRRARARARAEE